MEIYWEVEMIPCMPSFPFYRRGKEKKKKKPCKIKREIEQRRDLT